MRVLLDANLPGDFRHEIHGQDVQTARFAGLGDLDDGSLLDHMPGCFDVLVTMDTSIVHQQNIRTRRFAVIVLRAKSSRIADLLPLVPALLDALDEIAPGEAREVE